MFSFLFIVVPEEEKLDGDKGSDFKWPRIKKPYRVQQRYAKLAIEACRDMVALSLQKYEMRRGERCDQERLKEPPPRFAYFIANSIRHHP